MVLTQGALNAMQRSIDADPNVGLILLGGISRHYEWHDGEVLSGVRKLVESTPQVRWTLTTSPRTPASLLDELLALAYPNLEVIPFQQTAQGWLLIAQCLIICAICIMAFSDPSLGQGY